MDCVLLFSAISFLLVRFCNAAVYTHSWAAHIEGGEDVAKFLAEKHGFKYLGKVGKVDI